MPSFSKRSLTNLNQLHPLLQKVCRETIKVFDFTILDAQRGRAEQERAFKDGFSRAHFGQSAHNYYPAVAMDICPYPIDWNNIDAFKDLNGVLMPIAKKLDVPLEWGGTWKSIRDYPHYELKPWREWAKKSALIED